MWSTNLKKKRRLFSGRRSTVGRGGVEVGVGVIGFKQGFGQFLNLLFSPCWLEIHADHTKYPGFYILYYTII